MRAKEFINETCRKKINEQEPTTDLSNLDKLSDISPPEGSSLWSKTKKALAPVGKTINKIAPYVGGAEAARSFYNQDYLGGALGLAQMMPHPAIRWPAVGVDLLKSQADDPDSWLSQLPFRNIGPEGGATPPSEWTAPATKTAATDQKPQTQGAKVEPSSASLVAKTPSKDVPATDVPTAGKEYTVRPGDYLSKIAAQAGLGRNWQELYKQNIGVVGDNPNLIYPGQKLKIPTAPTGGNKPTPTANVGRKGPQRAAGEPGPTGVRYAADLNNPSGLGWNGKTWYAFDTPEEGVAATQRQLRSYLSGKGYMAGQAPTPENVVSTWVTGGTTPAEKIQGGSYVQSVRNELAKSGVKLGPKGEIPNTPEARLAITRAMVRHETAPQHRAKFQSALYPEIKNQHAKEK